MIDKATVARHFSRAAASYAGHARLQATVAERLAARLPDGPLERIFEAGCGTGFLTDRLLARWPQAAFDLVEIAPAMADACRSKYAGHPAVRVHTADAELWEPDSGSCYGLVASSTCVQWFHDPGAALARWRGRLVPGGQLALATLGPGTFAELAAAAAEAARRLGIEHRRTYAPTLPAAADWQAWLADWRDVRLETETQVLRYPTARDFLQALRATGAGNALSERAATPPALVRSLPAIYDELFGGTTGVPAGYEVFYITARV